MDLKSLCLKLAFSEMEKDIIGLLKKVGYWDDPKVWHYYGDNENNFATIGNQQSKPESAVVEKIINSVDAVLMAECLKRKVDPSSKHAPHSISEALNEYFGILDGRLSNITPTERTKLANSICLVATGAKSNPCYSIIDNGEGQTPDTMPETSLSIGRSNKLRIPFVQGKFNMGGTGVFQFCGQNNLQLIISKRNPYISQHKNDDNSKNKWGFTLVRRQNPSKGMRSSAYKYLAPNNKILSFTSDGLPLMPGKYPEPYKEMLEWGTFIKLYEYQMTGLKTNILFDLYNRLSLLMPSIAIPVRFFERRKGYTGHSMETTLAGLTVRLDEDRRENLEEGYPTSSTLSVHGQKMKASIYAFKKGQSQKYTKDEGIIFTINGQTHAYISKAFFERRAVQMGYLTDSLLVIVDCSEFDGRTREDLFMNSRDRLRAGDLRSEIERTLEDILKTHSGLRELKERRRREEIENKLGDSKPLADVIMKILKASPTLSKLFIDGVRIPNPFKVDKGKSSEVYKGNIFPTYFKLIRDYTEDNPKTCAINSKCRIQFKTDVVNDYFDRDSDRGTFKLFVNGFEYENYSINLWNGIATLNLGLPSNKQIKELLLFNSNVSDVSRAEPFEELFYIEIAGPYEKNDKVQGSRKPPSSNQKGDDVEKKSYLDLPNVREIRSNEWEKCDFNKFSALKVIDSGEEGFDFYVNMD